MAQSVTLTTQAFGQLKVGNYEIAADVPLKITGISQAALQTLREQVHAEKQPSCNEYGVILNSILASQGKSVQVSTEGSLDCAALGDLAENGAVLSPALELTSHHAPLRLTISPRDLFISMAAKCNEMIQNKTLTFFVPPYQRVFFIDACGPFDGAIMKKLPEGSEKWPAKEQCKLLFNLLEKRLPVGYAISLNCESSMVIQLNVQNNTMNLSSDKGIGFTLRPKEENKPDGKAECKAESKESKTDKASS